MRNKKGEKLYATWHCPICDRFLCCWHDGNYIKSANYIASCWGSDETHGHIPFNRIQEVFLDEIRVGTHELRQMDIYYLPRHEIQYLMGI